MTTVRSLGQALALSALLALFVLLATVAPSAFSAPAFAAPQQPGYPNPSHFGGAPDRYAFWYRQCMRVKPRQPHTGDLQPGQSACKAGNPSASDLCYDKLNQASTSQREWDQVRYCATASHDTAVLMMLHANGLGMPGCLGALCSTALSRPRPRVPQGRADAVAPQATCGAGAGIKGAQQFQHVAPNNGMRNSGSL